MLDFKYTAINTLGEQFEGILEAENQEAAIAKIKANNLNPTSLVKVRPVSNNNSASIFDRVSLKDIVNFSRQMSALLEAGVPILKAFQLIEVDIEKPYFKSIISSIVDDIKAGKSISESLMRHRDVFGDFYVSMVRSGEESAKTSETFAYLAEYLDRSYTLTVKVRNSMIYPTFVVVTFVIVMILVFTMVIPKLATILTDSNVELPLITQIVLGISNFLVDYGIYLLALIVIGSIFVYVRLSDKSRISDYLDDIKLRIPFLNNLFKMLYMIRIADNVDTLLNSGVSFPKSISITADVVGNSRYKKMLNEVLVEVRGGVVFSDALSKYPELISSTMVQMIRIGEETAEVGKLLGHIAKFYQREVNATIDTIIGMIEPAMIVLLGLGVGLLLVSVLLPIYNLASAF